MDLNKQRISKFLYHFGKGLWKSVPVLGPIVEEVFYEQFKEELTNRVEMLSETDAQILAERMPDIDLKALERKLEDLSMEAKADCLVSYSHILEAITLGLTEVHQKLDGIGDHVAHIPDMRAMIEAISGSIDDKQQMQTLLNEFEHKRQTWIRRLSKNQRKLLSVLPQKFTHVETLWRCAEQIIHGCGYKEFRFRLHEIEWLGLVERYWNQERSAWYYRLSSEGKQQHRIGQE